MRNISVSINKNSTGIVCDIKFKDIDKPSLFSVDVRSTNSKNEPCFLLKNRLIYVKKTFCNCNINIENNFVSNCNYVVVEIHSSGKLVYIKKFNVISKENDELFYYCRNQDICFRLEDKNTISLFNTNGNLLFVRGIYKDIWEFLETPLTIDSLKKNIDLDKTKLLNCVNALINKNVILKVQNNDLLILD